MALSNLVWHFFAFLLVMVCIMVTQGALQRIHWQSRYFLPALLASLSGWGQNSPDLDAQWPKNAIRRYLSAVEKKWNQKYSSQVEFAWSPPYVHPLFVVAVWMALFSDRPTAIFNELPKIQWLEKGDLQVLNWVQFMEKLKETAGNIHWDSDTWEIRVKV